MAEEIVIGKLIIDNSDLDRAMLESKRAIVELENEQKKLKKETEGLTTANEEQLKTFVQNEAALKRARQEYSANQKTVLEVTRAQTGLDDALKKNIKTQDDATANTKALTEARRKIDATTLEGAKAIAVINAKIDENNKFLNANNSTLEQTKVNIGNYPTLMGAVSTSFNGATSSVLGFAQKGKAVISELSGTVENFRTTQEASKVASEAYAAAQIAETVATEAATVAEVQRTAIGFQYAAGKATATEVEAANTAATVANAQATAAQATTQQAATVATTAGTAATRALSLAMLAIPLVALLALIVPLISFLTSTQEGMDKVTAVTRPLIAIFESLIGVLQDIGRNISFDGITNGIKDLYNYVKDKVVKQFEGLYDVIVGIATLDFDQAKAGMKTLGDNAKSIVGDIGEVSAKSAKFLAEAIAKGVALDKLEKDLEITRTKNILLLGKATEEVKAQNRIAEDQTKTSKEREEATAKSIVAAKEINRLKNMELDIEIAILKNKQSRNDTSRAEEAELNTLIAKKNENNATLLELETTQTNKINTIRKEAQTKAATAQKAATDLANKEAKNRIDILKAEAAQSNLNAAERIANAQKVFELENDLAKRTSSGSDLQKSLLQNKQELSSQILAITQEQINAELEAQKKAFAENKKITQEQFDAQMMSANDLATAQILLLDKSLLSEKAYADAVLEITKGKNDSILALTAAFDEGEKVRRETQIANEALLSETAFQIRMQDILDRDATEQEIKTALLDEQYARELEQLNKSFEDKTLSEEAYLQKRLLAEKKYSSDTKKNDKILIDQKRASNIKMVNDSIGALENLFGESKALAVASALMNTYEGISAALKAPTLPQRIAGVAFATATGFKAVQNINKTNKGSSSEGVSSTPITTTGTGDFVNDAQTSTIATVTERPVEQNTVVTPPVLVLETLMEVQNQVLVKVNSD